MQALIITLDGPAGSGKSSVSHELAKRLGMAFLDTGAMYRGITAASLDRGIDPSTGPQAVVKLSQEIRLWFDWQADPPRMHATTQGNADQDLTDRLRDEDVTANVSEVAAMSGVRKVLVKAQQRIGEEHPRLVTEGRDQGTVVFPHAHLKFYIDANPQVRAQRRVGQHRQAGKKIAENEILSGIIKRDALDSTRADGPLMQPDDAIYIETSQMTLGQVVDLVEQYVQTYRAAQAGSSS